MTPSTSAVPHGGNTRREPVNKWLVAASVGFGALMGAIDASIVNVALPQIRGAVGATIQEITWISTGYAIALVLVMPLTAFLGRMFGQKRVYLFCLGLFVAGSALCGVAGSLGTLVVFRVLQGFGGGALQPTQQAILRQTFPPKQQGMAMALFGMVVMLGPAIGPTLGGVIVDHWHWSWIFFINVPIGVIGIFMVSAFVHEDEEVVAASRALTAASRKAIDWAGIGLMTVGLSALQYVLEEGGRDDWFESPLIVAMSLAAGIALVAFVIRELTAETPAVDLRLFVNPVFAAGTAVAGLMFMMLTAGMFLLPVFMQELLGFTATQSGIALVPRVAAMVIAMPIVGRLYEIVSPRVLVASGVVMVALGSMAFGHLTLASGTGDIVLPIVLQGVGFAALFVPLTTLALADIPRHRLADAAGLNSLVRQLGGAIGLAVFATLLGNYAVAARSGLSAHLSETDPFTQQRLAMLQSGLAARGLDPVSAASGARAALYGIAVRQSMVLSFERLFVFAGVLFLLAMPAVIFLKSRMKPAPAGEMVHVDA